MHKFIRSLFRGYSVILKKDTQKKFNEYIHNKQLFLESLQKKLDEKMYSLVTIADRYDFNCGQEILQEIFVQGLLYGIAIGTECYKETTDSLALSEISSGQVGNSVYDKIKAKTDIREQQKYKRLRAYLSKRLSKDLYETFIMLNEINDSIVYLLHQDYFTDGIYKGLMLGTQAISEIGQI